MICDRIFYVVMETAEKRGVAGISPAFLIKKFTVHSCLCMIYVLLASFAA